MKKKSSPKRIKAPSKAVRARPTITFQPDDDVLQVLNDQLKKLAECGVERGAQTKVINEALRLKMAEAARIVHEEDLQEWRRRRGLRDKGEGTS